MSERQIHSVTAEIAGRTLTIETGRMAEQADGAVTVRYGDTLLLATVVGAKETREGIDFFPLTVDYEEKMYAAGKIPGSFFKREGRPTQTAILTSRLTDRPLRPLFPKGYRNEVQVIITTFSIDMVNDPGPLAIIGASAALAISDLPFAGPVGAALVGHLDGRLNEAINNPNKTARVDATDALRADVLAQFTVDEPEEELPARQHAVEKAFDALLKEAVRSAILATGQRVDGRSPSEIRPISVEVGVVPRVHGTGLFTRGQTQVLTITTLGSPGDEQRLDDLGVETTKRYIHHYNFPPFSTGEAKRIGSPRRRDIGHGALAERSLLAVLPSKEEFPYTMRLVSEVLSSNGSSSMASVCGSSLSLMDAGVPIKRPVAGVAMGLITGPNGQWKVLTDIQGLEDNLGDMDFKVAGTVEGVTGLQMDIKTTGITYDIMRQAFAQARDGRLFILDKMNAMISEPREELSPFAPRIITLQINPEKIGALIGPGGKTIRSITDTTGAQIDVERSEEHTSELQSRENL